MNRQRQWLFEIPVSLASAHDRNLHPEYYQHIELEGQWKIPLVSALPEEEWGGIPEWEIAGSSDYPKASRFVSANYYGKSKSTRAIRRIVIHITDGGSNINGTVSWFQYMLGKDGKPAVDRTGKLIKASAHYIIGQDGEVVQMVRENDVSYHSGSANSDSIGIEHVARKPRTFSRTDKGLFPSQTQYCSSATLVRWLCHKYSIPMNRVYILGHAEADLKTSHKSCPNSVWNWDYFMKLVTGVQPCSAVPLKPPVSPVTPDHWKSVLGGAQVRSGNQVEFLIDGQQSFEAMVKAIKTATGSQHYIYLLGWWLTDNFPLIPTDPNSTISRLFAAAARAGVQIRVMLWDQFGTQNSPEVQRINALRTGGAILDNETLNFGSHHQKVLVVKGSQGLISFCGGVDINPDRIVASSGSKSGSSGGQGTPLHDVHSQIRGPAAHDLLNLFGQRWFAHPSHTKIDATKGALLGLREPIPGAIGNHNVRIARTFNLITATKCQKARSIRSVMIAAIRAARKFIYIEDQYLVNMEAAVELKKALPNLQHVTIVFPHSSISDMPQVWARRKAFIDLLKSGPHAHKVRVFYLVNPTTGGFGPLTYVHAKMWVIDDEVAVIGSANCNRRGWSHDSEVIAAIYDAPSKEQPPSSLAQRLRMTLWAKHLNVPLSAVRDGVASASLWLKPPAGAWVRPYNQNGGKDPVKDKLISWDSLVDPSGDHLPACSGGIETETKPLIMAELSLQH